jgi:MFS family permease
MKKSIISVYFVLLTMAVMSVSFIAGIYSNFLRSHGLNELELNLVNVAFFLTIFLFEIPTGIYADVFGRKKSFIISCILMAVGQFVYSRVHSFWGFIIAEVIVAIAMTFSSGAFQSWFASRMKHYGYKEKLTKIFAWEVIVKAGACMIAAMIGGKLADSSYALTWIAGCLTSLVTAILAALLMKEEYFEEKSFSWNQSLVEVRNTTSESLRYVKTNKAFRFILVIGFVLTFAVMAPNMQWQKIFKDHFNLNFYVSLVMVAAQIMIMSGGYMSRWLLPLFNHDEKKAIIVCQALIGLTIVLTVITSSLPVIVVFFMAHEVFRGMFKPIKDAYLQDMLPEKERATLTSFESMYGHLGGALGLVTSGWLAKSYGIPTAWIVAGSIMMISSLILISKNKKGN